MGTFNWPPAGTATWPLTHLAAPARAGHRRARAHRRALYPHALHPRPDTAPRPVSALQPRLSRPTAVPDPCPSGRKPTGHDGQPRIAALAALPEQEQLRPIAEVI